MTNVAPVHAFWVLIFGVSINEGATNGDMANRLGISEDTVKVHMSRSYKHKRLGVNSRSQALDYARSNGFLRHSRSKSPLRRDLTVNRPASNRAEASSTLLARLLLRALTWLLTWLLLTRVLLLLPRVTRASLSRLLLSGILLLLAWVARLIAGLVGIVLT